MDVPVIVWGSGNAEKDTDVLRKVAEACDGMNLVIGPVAEGNYKQVGAGAIGYKHTAIASTPIDINLAKQLNILLGNLGVPDGQIVVDPTTGGLGYGIEYTYSVMERDRMAALTQQDERLQFPILCNMAREVWKTKEAKTEDRRCPYFRRCQKERNSHGGCYRDRSSFGRGRCFSDETSRGHQTGPGDDCRFYG